MINGKLYRVISSFDRYELNRLEKFINSPYFNKHARLIQIFSAVKESIILGTDLDEAALGRFVMGAEYDLKKFRKLTSQLLSLVQDYLAQQIYENNPLHQANFLLRAVLDKKLEDLYNSAKSKSERLASRQLYRSSDYFYQKYRYERLLYELSGVEVTRDKRSVIENLNIETLDKNLDTFYFIEKLRSEILLLYWQNVYEHKYSLTFKDEILNHIKQINLDVGALEIYYYSYLCYAHPDNELYYEKLYNLIREVLDSIPQDEAKDIHKSALNYCIRRINKGEKEYLREAFKLYQEGLQNETLFDNDLLTPALFRNICTTALRLEEYEWCLSFIEEYKSRLEKHTRESLVALTTAQVYFYQKQFEQVLPFLNSYESQDPKLNLTARLLAAASYYELDLFDLLDSHLDSMKIYLHRNKAIPQKIRSPYQNFIKYLNRILSAGTNGKKLSEIKKQINENKDSYNSSWLIEKIDELL